LPKQRGVTGAREALIQSTFVIEEGTIKDRL